jgi:hypothetical protein
MHPLYLEVFEAECRVFKRRDFLNNGPIDIEKYVFIKYEETDDPPTLPSISWTLAQ